MARLSTLSRPQCACGHRHHDPDDLERIADQLVCRCPRCWASVVIAARIGVQLRAFDNEPVPA